MKMSWRCIIWASFLWKNPMLRRSREKSCPFYNPRKSYGEQVLYHPRGVRTPICQLFWYSPSYLGFASYRTYKELPNRTEASKASHFGAKFEPYVLRPWVHETNITLLVNSWGSEHYIHVQCNLQRLWQGLSRSRRVSCRLLEVYLIKLRNPWIHWLTNTY